MTTRIRPITRAVIMLDQSSGELRQDDGELLGLDLWPETRATFSTLSTAGLEIILAVPTDLPADAVSQLAAWGTGIRVAAISPAFSFSPAGAGFAGLTETDPATALVSADRRLRGEAAQAGMQPAPHVAVLPMMQRGIAPEAVRMVGPREKLTRLALTTELIPLHFQPASGADWALIALVAEQVQAAAIMQGIAIHPLPYDPMTADLVWARIDADSPEVREVLAQRRILHAEPGQVLLALTPDEDTEALHIHGGHGHSEVLMPSPQLLQPAVLSSLEGEAIDPRILTEDILEPVKLDPLRWRLLYPSCSKISASYESDLNRYTGIDNLDAAGPIASRHSAHADNKRAEDQLLKDLQAIGYCAYRHTFTHAGQTHSNIIADLPGAGLFRIKLDILERYRRILCSQPLPKPFDSLADQMPELAGSDWFQESMREPLSDIELRYRIEKLFRLQPWYPWWKWPCLVPNYGADLVIVGCHMDSTAGFEPGYNATTDPAPGRDDNASGLAAVLSMARYLWGLRGRFRHTIRFCFFNAEESGLVGSKAYAAKMKALSAPIRAVVCMDMIGHNSDANRLFEIHAGYTDPAIRDLSLPLASPVADAAAAYGMLAPAQVYAGTSWSGAPDRTVYDGAINRSDHAAFHQQGYPAVLVSEDFFANLAAEPGADPNPNYHRAADTLVDLAYAKDITCAVTRAVMNLAN